MYSTKSEFIEDIQSIFKFPFYHSIIEHSLKITEHSVTNNRCIVMIYSYHNPDIPNNQIDGIPSYTYFIKEEILSKLNETKYYNPKVFQNFINNTLFHYYCETLIFGVDIDNRILKFYLSLKDNNNNNCISIIKCMEIDVYGKVKYKLYNPIYEKEQYYHINNLIFGKYNFGKYNVALNKNLNEYYGWGYYRMDITNNKKQIYGVDFFIEKPFLEIKSKILKIMKEFNMWNFHPNKTQIMKFLEENSHNTLCWLTVNCKNNKFELCLYYRYTQ